MSFNIEYINFKHEVLCPEYITTDGDDVVVIPWFLNPYRRYPIQIYLYACDLYSANPSRGQRWVAEATRAKFNLNTFSHTTLCRAFKSIEESQKKALEKRFGSEFKAYTDECPPPASNTKNRTDDEQKAPDGKRRFPSIEDTAERRKAMNKFLLSFHNAAEEGDINTVACEFVKNWYEKTKQLLL